jgi:hypothetical protein
MMRGMVKRFISFPSFYGLFLLTLSELISVEMQSILDAAEVALLLMYERPS